MVGANVANALRQEGYTVRAAVRDPAAEKNEFLRAMGCELVRVPDLLSDEGWAEAMAGCVGLAHVASPVDIAGNTPEDVMISQAVEGTERALRFAAEAGTIKRVVVTATTRLPRARLGPRRARRFTESFLVFVRRHELVPERAYDALALVHRGLAQRIVRAAPGEALRDVRAHHFALAVRPVAVVAPGARQRRQIVALRAFS